MAAVRCAFVGASAPLLLCHRPASRLPSVTRGRRPATLMVPVALWGAGSAGRPRADVAAVLGALAETLARLAAAVGFPVGAAPLRAASSAEPGAVAPPLQRGGAGGANVVVPTLRRWRAGRARERGPTDKVALPPLPLQPLGCSAWCGLALFHTPGVWRMPLKLMATAAEALGGVDVFTITLLRKPILTTVVSHRAVAAALSQPEKTLSVDAVHSTARRALEPPPPRRTAAEAAEDARVEAAVVPTLLRHMRAALTRTWWTCTDGISARLDRVIACELARAVAAPLPSSVADGPASAGATVDLFDVFSKVVLYAGASAFLGDDFVTSHGDVVWRGFRDWQRSAWTLPWVLFPRTARRLRPALLDAHTRAFGPILAKVSRVMAGTEAAERGTYLADMIDALDARASDPPSAPCTLPRRCLGCSRRCTSTRTQPARGPSRTRRPSRPSPLQSPPRPTRSRPAGRRPCARRGSPQHTCPSSRRCGPRRCASTRSPRQSACRRRRGTWRRRRRRQTRTVAPTAPGGRCLATTASSPCAFKISTRGVTTMATAGTAWT
eukprot:TRINITY_DN773_c0_g1_i7.p1 TRINITY_DN773_c0_g1~~TRINITY_DN773_c0_g1_i7.p1  ORF type:complete len:553 (-),score=89.93 TRINITY_DN773_c0_g1_i7:198-1856(-)